MYLSGPGCLLRRADSGERHLLLVAFLRDHGLRHIMARKRTGSAATQLPDLFECGDYSIAQKGAGGPSFLREYTATARVPDIAGSYARLQSASRLARFYERNLLHLEHYTTAWDLLLTALRSMERSTVPEAVLLKALYAFARSEGYPVKAQWLDSLPSAQRERLAELLFRPVGETPAGPEETRHWIGQLCRYFDHATDLLPPEM